MGWLFYFLWLYIFNFHAKLSKTIMSKSQLYPTLVFRCLNNLSVQESKLLCEEETTVQGALETGLELKLKPLNTAIIYLSSRSFVKHVNIGIAWFISWKRGGLSNNSRFKVEYFENGFEASLIQNKMSFSGIGLTLSPTASWIYFMS